MRGSVQDNAALAVDAYMAWWQLAGVEDAVAEEPVDWLRPAVAASPAMGRETASATQAVSAPRDLGAFRAWLESESCHPERRWPSRPIYPVGEPKSRLMVVTDMPDPADVDAGALLADRAGALFDAMLRAIGFQRSDIHLASLFFARPPGGMVEAADLSVTAARMRTHIHLAQPHRLLLLGDRTIRALMPMDGAQPRNSLQDFKHDGGIVPAVSTFHPRLLLGQPAAKAECWRALQSLIEEVRL